MRGMNNDKMEAMSDVMTARCPDRSGDAPVAEFELTISVKAKTG